MRGLVLSVGAIVVPAGAAAGQEPGAAMRLDYPAVLALVAGSDWLWRPPLAGERCVQFSSFDRASRAGAANPFAWYANDDRGHYLATERNDGADEFVLAECAGPGCVARIWSANPAGRLRVVVDGQRVLDVDFGRLCRGELAGVPPPLAATTARGGNVYLPIPFARHLRVATDTAGLYYHVDVHTWPAAVAVEPFTTATLAAHAEPIARLCAQFPTARAGYDHDVSGVVDALRVPEAPPGVTRRSGGTSELSIEPATLVRSFRIALGIGLTPAEQREVIGRATVVVRCGDTETVRVPLTDFFAAGPAWRDHGGRFLSVDGDQACCAWPMPMPAGGAIRIETEGEPGRFAPTIRSAWVEPLADPDPLLFRASYHLAKDQPTRPFADHLVLDALGQGRFVGCSLLVNNRSRIWWGEGDEKLWVDGEVFPSWFGTGTEDYFGYAWCDPTPFAAPFHAQVQCDGPMNFGFTQLHRCHGLDSVPFQRSFRFELERWHWVDTTTVDYATVAYWYGAPGACSGLPPVPKAADRALRRLDGPPTFVADGALEGEQLRVVACSGGAHEVQDLGVFERTFSRDRDRWWRGGAVGDALVLAVPVARAGRYRVKVAMVQAEDFGIVQLSLGTAKLGEPIDGYAVGVHSTGPRELGTVALPAGDSELRLEIVGRHPQAKPGHMVGLDYLVLEKVE